MPSWYGTYRSNYFKVKDETAFREWAKQHELEIFEEEGFAICSRNEFGDWPLVKWNDETHEFDDIDIFGELAEHLQDDQIAILMSAGADKFRYITGYAVAVNSKGERCFVNLDDIYGMAAEKFNVDESTMTMAEG